jgi:peptide/nickel transport system permease protein
MRATAPGPTSLPRPARALFGDVYVVQACTLVAVVVAVTSQIISDVGYTFLNPRIRFA